MKFFLIFMVIWEYDVLVVVCLLGWVVVVNNVEVFCIFLDCKYYIVCLFVLVGVVSRWVIGRMVLVVVGLGDVDLIMESSVVVDGKVFWVFMIYVREWVGCIVVG